MQISNPMKRTPKLDINWLFGGMSFVYIFNYILTSPLSCTTNGTQLRSIYDLQKIKLNITKFRISIEITCAFSSSKSK